MKARAEGSCLQFDARCTVSPALTGERASLCDAERKNMKLIRCKWNLGDRRDIPNPPSGSGAEKKSFHVKGCLKMKVGSADFKKVEVVSFHPLKWSMSEEINFSKQVFILHYVHICWAMRGPILSIRWGISYVFSVFPFHADDQTCKAFDTS